MFEKEAKKWVKENTRIEYSASFGEFPKEPSATKSFKAGAEFGYNKANEWHKPSEKLPKECTLVLAYSFDDTEPSLYEYVASDTWEWMPRRIAFLSNNQIRLWKEIVLPKEIKEND